MEDLLANPAFQAGIFPFLGAFVIALALSFVGNWSGLSLAAGFCILILLTTGFIFDPLTSTRKTVLMGILAPFIAIVLPFVRTDKIKPQLVFLIVSSVTAIWVIWPVVSRNESLFAAGTMVLAAGMYAIWTTHFATRLAHKHILSAGSGVAALGFATGGSAMLGASALLGQMAIAIGASAGAFIIVYLIRNTSHGAGYIFTFTAAILLSLIGINSVVYAKVPWYTLLATAMILPLAHIALAGELKKWTKALIWFVLGMIPASIAMYATYESQGPALY